MRNSAATLLCLLALVSVLGCESRTDKSEGGVILSVSDFDGLPATVSVNLTDFLQIEQIEIQNIPKNPNAPSSDLENVEMRSYEVVYTRTDAGTRVPTPFVRSIFGVAPVDGIVEYDGLPIMGSEQFDNLPLTDLLFVNGGFDTETGNQFIILKFRIRFFGRTLTGDSVATAPIEFDVEFVP
jgi:hypothetical protein